MPGLFGNVGPEFGLADLKIAAWNGDGTYGTAVDIPSAQMMDVNLQTTNAQLEGDDIITDTHALGKSAQIRIKFGSISLEALAVITGNATVNSPGVSPTAFTQRMGNIKFPYFGLCGRALSTRDAGDAHIFVPMMKCMEGFTLTMQYGQYAVPEITCTAIFDSTYQDIYRIVKHKTAVEVTIPPVFSA